MEIPLLSITAYETSEEETSSNLEGNGDEETDEDNESTTYLFHQRYTRYSMLCNWSKEESNEDSPLDEQTQGDHEASSTAEPMHLPPIDNFPPFTLTTSTSIFEA